MKKLNLLLFLLSIFYCASLSAQTWDGGGGDTNWNNNFNWDTDLVPLPGALVEFTQTVAVTSTGTVLTPSQIRVRGAGTKLTLDLDITVGGLTPVPAIRVDGNTELVIPDTRTLILNPPMTEHGIVNFSGAANAAITVDAGGTINIVLADRGMNLRNSSFVFTNNGTITIGSCDDDGINLGVGASFINNGTMTLGLLDRDGIDNSGNFTNNGALTIISANNKGINNKISGTFNNDGLIDMSDFLITMDDGIYNLGNFYNDTLGVISITRMTDDAIEALRGTFTNDGTISLIVNDGAMLGNEGIRVGSNTVSSTFLNNGIIEVDAGSGVLSRAIHVLTGSGSSLFTNNGLVSLDGGNPNQTFFSKGTTINGPVGTLNTGNGRMNVNLGTFTNNGLFVSNYPTQPGVFTNLTGNSVNDGFFRHNNISFSNGAGSIVDNGVNMNDPTETTFDLGGGCDVTVAGVGATQTWLNVFGDTIDIMGPDLSFMDALPNTDSATIVASGIDVRLTVRNVCLDAVLPIELLDFSAFPKEKSVLLEWETISEIDNDYMAVERSADADKFVEIGRLAGAGNSSSNIRYELEDTAPLTGINYYRLRQVDFDGTTSYSQIVAVNFKGQTTAPPIALYPNLVRTGGSMELDLRYAAPEAATYIIVNSQGQQVASYTFVGGTRQELIVNDLPAGMYYLLNTNVPTSTGAKFVILR